MTADFRPPCVDYIYLFDAAVGTAEVAGDGDAARKAAAVCAGCPARVPCAQIAVEANAGISGGYRGRLIGVFGGVWWNEHGRPKLIPKARPAIDEKTAKQAHVRFNRGDRDPHTIECEHEYQRRANERAYKRRPQERQEGAA